MNIFQYFYYKLSLFLTKDITIRAKTLPVTTWIIVAIWLFVIFYIIYNRIKFSTNFDSDSSSSKYTQDEYKQLKRIKKYNSINNSNVFVDDWVQRVYDDGIIFIFHDVYVDNNNKPIPDLHFYDYIVTTKYVMKIWANDKFHSKYCKGIIWTNYGYFDNKDAFGKIKKEDKSKSIIAWDNTNLNKKLKYKLLKMTLDYNRITESNPNNFNKANNINTNKK